MSSLAVPADSWSNLLPAVGSFFAWTTLYFTLCILNSRRSYEWHVRALTAVHAVTVCAMSGWSGFVLGPWPFTDPGGPMTRMEYVTCNVCLGYFLFDFAWCLFFQTEGLVMLLHHALSILGNALIIYWGVSGTEMMAAIFGSELTNPFLQMRWFLRSTERHKTWYGEANDVVFMLLFFYLRILVGTSLLYWVLRHPRPCSLVKLGGVLHYTVGLAFLVMIIRYAIRKYTKMYKEHVESGQQEDIDCMHADDGHYKDLANGQHEDAGRTHVGNGQQDSSYYHKDRSDSGAAGDYLTTPTACKVTNPTNGLQHRKPRQT